MKEYRYFLQPYTTRSSRHQCPQCSKPNQFSKYIDSTTGEFINDIVGRCNRIDKCGYHYTPKQYFEDNGIAPEKKNDYFPGKKHIDTPTSFIEQKVLNESLLINGQNNLVRFLLTFLDSEKVNHLVKMYHLGTSNHWGGGTTIFWQVDQNNNIRTGKLIKYDPATGKRIKFEGGCLTNWVHAVFKIKNFNLKQCFFGEHLLQQFPEKLIGIVESEKTAIIASIFFPDLIWLATGGAENINQEKVKSLQGRKVILFPDASEGGIIYQKWREKAKEFGFEISDYLEINTNDVQKSDGVDIADFLIIENSIDSKPEIKLLNKKGINESNEINFQAPYNTPSSVALLDSKIENPPNFKGKDLVIKSGNFISINGDKIELVGLRDYGFCGNWANHKKAKGYCKPCMLNCMHTLKINDKLVSREYTQLEVLLLQGSVLYLNSFHWNKKNSTCY